MVLAARPRTTMLRKGATMPFSGWRDPSVERFCAFVGPLKSEPLLGLVGRPFNP